MPRPKNRYSSQPASTPKTSDNTASIGSKNDNLADHGGMGHNSKPHKSETVQRKRARGFTF